MNHRRLLVAFLLVAAMSVAGLAADLPGLRSEALPDRSAGEAATGAVAVAGLEAAVVRVKLDERRHVAGQRFSSKVGLWLVAVLAFLVGWLPFRRGWCDAAGPAAPLRFGWWSPISGRAPPCFLLRVR